MSVSPTPSPAVPFSVIIPTRDRLELLAECLARLAPGAQSLPGDGYEVIVTDDARPPGAAGALAARFPGVRWTQGPARGPAANRNHGARQARGDWLVFTDDDCQPEPGWLAAYAEARRAHPAARVLEGRTYADRPQRLNYERAPINETGGLLWSCNFAIERALFYALGGFDERFTAATMEDMDFAERLRERGEAFPFVRAAGVCHPWRLADLRKSHRPHVEALLFFLQLHPQRQREHQPGVYLRPLLKGLRFGYLPPLRRRSWAEVAASWRSTRMILRLMWEVPRLARRPAPAAPGPQPWPPT